MKKLVLSLGILLMPVLAFSSVPVDLSQEVPVQDFLAFLIQSMGGMKGASTLAVVAIILQGALILFRTSLLDKFSGKYKLLIVYALSLVGGIVALMTQGIDFNAALIHSNSLAAYQVFFHQVIKHVAEKKNESPSV